MDTKNKNIDDKKEIIPSDEELIYELMRSGQRTYPNLYDFHDIPVLMNMTSDGSMVGKLYDLERLLEKDKLREKDGFPRKIKLGKLIKPSKDGKGKTIVVPTATEEKFYHWNSKPEMGEGQSTGGTGDGDEGEVVGEESLRPEEGEGDGSGAGQGQGAEHGMGADAFEIGRILTEQFELPNIKDKGKRTALTKYTYDLTDKNKGHGQVLDKKATLKQVVKTNLALGFLDLKDNKLDTSKMIIPPRDRVYRILSREKDYESQAIVFFVRDYSGSMQGKPTEAVVTQHVYINSWLIYQYDRLVQSRFIVHDTEAEEVPDFYTYYNKNVAGGTNVSSAYKLVNKIVEEESLSRDYNIYIFHGTDGDDWEKDGKDSLIELKKMVSYSNRIGITVAENTWTSRNNSVVESYLKKSELLRDNPDIIHFDSFKATEADEKRLISGIKLLIS